MNHHEDARDDHDDDHALWRLTVKNSPVGMCLVGLDGSLWLPNRAFAEMTGRSVAQVRRMTFHEITHPDDLAGDLTLFRQTLRGERSSYRLVKRFVHADGHVVWGDLSAALVRDDDGTPRHFISQVMDVTTQRLDQERLVSALEVIERERSQLQAILDSVDVGLVLLDRQGRYERVNRRQREIWSMAHPQDGLAPVDEAGFLFAEDGVTPLEPDQLPMSRAVVGEEFDDERLWVGPDPSSRRALSVSARTVRDGDGRSVGAALAFGDVTDLVGALRAREVFERSISHELRTPLTSVLGHLEMLLETDLPAVARRQLGVLHRNATRLHHLVSDLLDPAAREDGAPPLACAPTDLAALLGEVVADALPGARGAGVVLALADPPEVTAQVDPHRVRQVLDNVVSNAVKYSDAGGRVDVELGLAAGVAEVCVTDDGIGIAPEDVARLFDPFFRTDAARGRATPGVGLGLGIARSIARAHGGDITVRSVPGDGSTFRVTLPLSARGCC